MSTTACDDQWAPEPSGGWPDTDAERTAEQVATASAPPSLRAAAQAVVDRWDTPAWKDVPHTGEFIKALREALAAPAPAGEPVAMDALRVAVDALEEIALAGMPGTGQESEESMGAWHARRAWEFIGVAARAIDAARSGLAAPPAAARVPLTRERILEIAEPFGCFELGDAQGDLRVAFARAIEAAGQEGA